VRFLRHFAAVTALVAAVVLIGLAWYHVAPGSLGGQGGSGGRQFAVRGQLVKGLPAGARRPGGTVQPPPGAKPPPGIHPIGPRIDAEIPGIQLGDLLRAVNLVVLRNTALIEAGIIAAVVAVDATLRRRRRARRAVAPGQAGTQEEPG
jgi:hypothetical protein